MRADSGFLQIGEISIVWFLVFGQPALVAAMGPTVRIHLGREETAFSWTRDRCSDEDIPDTPARAFRDEHGQVQLLAGHFVSYRMIGPSLATVKRDCRGGPIFASQLNHDPAQFADHEWLTSFYTVNGRDIAALVHDEYHGHAYPESGCHGTYQACWYNAITSTTSHDGGRSYRPRTQLVASLPYRYDPHAGKPHGYFQPSNLIETGGDVYALVQAEAYGAQPFGTCVMRADPKTWEWRFWNGQDFSIAPVNPYTNPPDNPSALVCTPVSRKQINKMHESVTWNTYLKQYLLVSADASWDLKAKRLRYGFYFSTSDDLIHWSQRQLFKETHLPWEHGLKSRDMWEAYPVLLDEETEGRPNTRNFERTDQRCYLYFTRKHSGKNFMNRDLIRVPVTVELTIPPQ